MSGTLSSQTKDSARAPTDLDDVVFATTFSPDGRILALARGARKISQRSGRIELWNTESGELRHVIRGFDGPVWSVTFSPDGKTMVSGSTEARDTKIREKGKEKRTAELKWWDVQTGELKQEHTMPGEGRLSLLAAYSPDGQQLATIEDYTQTMMRITDSNGPFDTQNPDRMFRRPVDFASVYGVDLKFLDAQTGALKRKLKASLNTDQTFGYRGRSGSFGRFRFINNQPERLLFSPNGQILADWTSSKVRLLNSQTGEAGRTLKDFKGSVNAIAFSPDGLTLAVAITNNQYQRSGDETTWNPLSEIKLFDLRTGKLARSLTGRGDTVTSLIFRPDGHVILVGTLQHEQDRVFGTIKLWDLQSGRLGSLTNGSEEAITGLALSPDGRALAVQSGVTTVQLLDTETWKKKWTLEPAVEPDNSKSASRFLLSVRRVLAVAFSSDGNTLSGEIEGGAIKVWDYRTGEVKQQIKANGNGASVFTVSPDGQTWAELNNESLFLLDPVSGTRKLLSGPVSQPISSAALSLAGEVLAFADDKDVTLLNTATGRVIRTLSGGQTAIAFLTFSADGSTMASAGNDGPVSTLDARTGTLIRTVSIEGKITAIALSAAGETLASASDDGIVSLWDLRAGGSRTLLKKHKGAVNAIAFSPDGRLLATGGDDRTVVIWEIGSGKSKQTLKGHDLTVSSLTFSRDGQLIASGSGNASVVLWDIQNGKLNRVLN